MTLVYDLDHRHGIPLGELTSLVGGKAANLNVMTTELGLPVPPGFVIVTVACNAYLADGWPAALDEEINQHLSHVERVTRRRFGDPIDPLLLSVRSGAPVSMPGMMDTILNVGLNDATTAGLGRATGDAAFAGDCQQRFVTMYRDIVGVAPPDDPRAQMRGAVEAVFQSWNAERARAFRRREGINEQLGTAVTLQAMVFGNRGADSATGVLFTRNPATGENVLYGDVMFNAQGEDVVDGTHRTEPLATLEERMPLAAGELRRCASALERHYADLCDIEFTIEQGRLWLLQVRVGKRSPQAAFRIAAEMAEDPAFPLSPEEAVRRAAQLLAHPPLVFAHRDGGPTPLTIGLPASPGVATGEIATSPDLAELASERRRPVILVRSETSPDDVRGIARAAGLLTARGGLASHAAVVARGWGIPAVVGASAVEVGDEGIHVDGRPFANGRVITIDGTTGEVFEGLVTRTSTIAPEAATLIGWAEQLGIPIGESAHVARTPVEAPRVAAGSAGQLAADDLMRTLLVKGTADPENLATASVGSIEQVGAALERLLEEGLVEASGGAFRLTGSGRLRAGELFAEDRERLGGREACGAALDGFAALDRRMKDTVTAWQLRDVDGEQILNDHLDDAHDGRVLARLAELHADTAMWLGQLSGRVARLDRYCDRLAHALELARDGDGRFVASPRVDSYHGIWFELHEDLLRLADRRRSDEVASGRA